MLYYMKIPIKGAVMISFDIKSDAKTTSSSALSLSNSSDEPTLSFSELLRGVSDKKDDKIIQNGSLLLSLETDEKPLTKGSLKVDTLLGLLKGDDKIEEEEPLELNPKLVENLSVKDIKLLVAGAKDYLKEKIQSSDDYKLSQIKELPKTLKGLASMAKKLGIDVSKITIQEVKTKQPLDKLAKLESMSIKEIPQEKEVKVKASPIRDILQEKKAQPIKETPKVNTPLHVKETPKVNTPLHVKETPKELQTKNTKVKALHVDTKVADAEAEVEEVKIQAPQVKDLHKKVLKHDVKVQTPLHVKAEHKEKEVKSTNVDADIDTMEKQKVDDKYTKVVKELKETPIFKAKESIQVTSTQQIVQVKASNAIDTKIRTPKDKADETLKLLLRGEKPSMKESTFTADFSVATAKVIAPSATTDAKKTVETLLHGESKAKDIDGAPESISAHKADSFEVKLNEAKQMVKYLSSDVKSAIEDYKSPFTRVKVQLNPQRLGEVDLTIVQRGKNLHVNISSNNAAINTLALNANDLKVQLANNGINNATLNFNNSQQDSQNAQQQQQNRQNERQANEEYNYFENEEANEEVLSSLEIVVPQYG